MGSAAVVTMKAKIKLWTWLAIFLGVLSESHFYDPESQSFQSLSASYASLNANTSQGTWRASPEGSGQSPKVLCAVFVDPKQKFDPKCHDNALVVKETWGSHCNELIFYGKVADETLPSVAVPNKREYGNLVHAFHMNKWDMLDRLKEFDWIFFARDDTFAVMENLKYHLSKHDPSKKLIWGFSYKREGLTDWSPLAISLGYAVTTAAFPEITGTGELEECQKLPPDEMFTVACLQEGGVEIIDFRDELGRHPVTNGNMGLYLISTPSKENIMLNSDHKYPIPKGPGCCSDDFVGGYLEQPSELFTLDYLSHDFQFPSSDPECSSTKLDGNSDNSAETRGEINNEDLDERSQDSHKHKILCLVNTTKEFHKTLALNVKNTWGQRCTKLVFMSDEEDSSLPALDALQSSNTWHKLKTSLIYTYSYGYNDSDWIFLAQHNGYVFFKNLVPLLEQYNPSEKLALGCRLKNIKSNLGYAPFECGVVLSKAAVKAFVEQATYIPWCKKGRSSQMDKKFSRCLQKVGVKFIDTRDCLGRHKFLPYSMEYFFSERLMQDEIGDWWLNNTFFPYTFGKKCCSRNIVSMGQLSNRHVYMYDFFEARFKLRGDDHSNSGVGASS